jgi:hypothetical protein
MSKRDDMAPIDVDGSSSSDDSDDDVPDASVCQERIDAFVQVTKQDSAFAQMFLQRRKWELEVRFSVDFHLIVNF